MKKTFNVVEAFNGRAVGDKFAIYVPNKDKDGLIIDQKFWIDKVIRVLAEIAGGATAMPPVTGAWLNTDTKHLIIEEPVVIYSYIDPEVFQVNLQVLNDLAREIGRETNQEAIAVEYNDTFILITDF